MHKCGSEDFVLARYHMRVLVLTGDGLGGWMMVCMGTAEAQMEIHCKIGSLEVWLAEVHAWEARCCA